MNRVIVCGSRHWSDRERISDRLCDLVLSYPPGAPIMIVHGNARGADRIAHQESQKHGLLVEVHPAMWGAYGKRAGPIRNAEMARSGADLCIAFWDGESVGTLDMIEKAEFHGIPVDRVMR